MDPRLTRGLLVLGAIGLYVLAGGKLPMSLEGFLQVVSLVSIGGATVRRPGDLEPVHEDTP